MDSEDSATHKRQRVSRACDMCRKKKVKCDGVAPICTNCQQLHYECTYKDTAKKRGPPKGYIDAIEGKLLKVEALVGDLLDTDGTLRPHVLHELKSLQTTNPIVRTKKSGHPHSTEEGRTTKNEQRLMALARMRGDRPADCATPDPRPGTYDRETVNRRNNDLAHFSADENGNMRYCGQSSGLWMLKQSARFQKDIFRPKRHPPSKQLKYSSVDKIPLEMELALIKGFFDHVYPIYPIVIPQQFWAMYMGNASDGIFRATKCAMLACTAKFIDLGPTVHNTNAELAQLYCDKANDTVSRHLFYSSITMTQILVLLAIYEHGCMTMMGWKYGGMALRMAYDLGLHRDPDQIQMLNNSKLDVELRRRVWWCCYVLDATASAVLGRPPVIKDMDFDCEFPTMVETPDDLGQIFAATVEQVRKAQGHSPVSASPTSFASFGANDPSPCTLTPDAPLHIPYQPPTANPDFQFAIDQHYHHLLALVHLLNRMLRQVYGYQSVFLKKEYHPMAIAIPVAQLDKQLRSWLINLPPDLKYSPSNYFMLRPPPHRFITIVHAMYHTTLILLHRPFLAQQWHIPTPSLLAKGYVSSQVDPICTLASRGACEDLTSSEFSSLQICTASSAALSCILQVVGQPLASGGSIFTIYKVMTAAIVHLHNAHSDNPRYALSARSYLKMSLGILDRLKVRWNSASKILTVLTELALERNIKLTDVPYPSELPLRDNLAYALTVEPSTAFDAPDQTAPDHTEQVPPDKHVPGSQFLQASPLRSGAPGPRLAPAQHVEPTVQLRPATDNQCKPVVSLSNRQAMSPLFPSQMLWTNLMEDPNVSVSGNVDAQTRQEPSHVCMSSAQEMSAATVISEHEAKLSNMGATSVSFNTTPNGALSNRSTASSGTHPPVPTAATPDTLGSGPLLPWAQPPLPLNPSGNSNLHSQNTDPYASYGAATGTINSPLTRYRGLLSQAGGAAHRVDPMRPGVMAYPQPPVRSSPALPNPLTPMIGGIEGGSIRPPYPLQSPLVPAGGSHRHPLTIDYDLVGPVGAGGGSSDGHNSPFIVPFSATNGSRPTGPDGMPTDGHQTPSVSGVNLGTAAATTAPDMASFIPTRGQNQSFFTNLDNFFFDINSLDFTGWNPSNDF
ncbi:hypothetical protein H4R34_001369 [Dimargaris verticillata]|uniref:Zn(2)-C6 fungal-type domain-containing protein n=1 Tax=Dimargaris verticillata TaxID=2761393 RepID=A0A9W8EAD3_9FUNG|nr:hypothetical protein H4R34_001369 [Dimargaris verticillata]